MDIAGKAPNKPGMLKPYLRLMKDQRGLAAAQLHQAVIAAPRAQDPLRLLKHGYKIFSQNDEDGILMEILRRIGIEAERFIEFGVMDGRVSNSALLLAAGWSGLWIEADPKWAQTNRETFAACLAAGRLTLKETRVTPENVDALLGGWAKDNPVDVLSIDIDSHDYWVWRSLTALRPRIAIVEYNAAFPPPFSLTLPRGEQGLGASFGASLKALETLGRAKGYALVGCCAAGVNAFFVRDDLADGPQGPLFRRPFTAEEHYEPPRYALAHLPGAHAFSTIPMETAPG